MSCAIPGPASRPTPSSPAASRPRSRTRKRRSGPGPAATTPPGGAPTPRPPAAVTTGTARSARTGCPAGIVPALPGLSNAVVTPRHLARLAYLAFGGLITTTRQAKALLEDPALTVFENPAAYLTCNYEPSRALCNPASGPGPANTPSLDRCRAGCPNMARTDAHAAGLRQAAAALRLQAGASRRPNRSPPRTRHDHRPRAGPDPRRDDPPAGGNPGPVRRRADRGRACRRGRRETARPDPSPHRPERRVLRPGPNSGTHPGQRGQTPPGT